MIRHTMVLALALPLALVACKGDDAGAAPGAAGSAAATGGAKPGAAGAAAAGLTTTDLPNPAGFTAGVPAGAKVEKTPEGASVETDAYRVKWKPAIPDGIQNAKTFLAKAPGYRAVIDQPDGVLIEFDDKGGKIYMLARNTKVGDQEWTCDSAMNKSPKSEAKAREAWEVCGSFKKK